MKKHFKSILSLFLAFTLIPAIPFNVVNATEPHKIPLGEVELAVGEEKPLGTCLIKADSAYLSAEPATCFSTSYSNGISTDCPFQTDGNEPTSIFPGDSVSFSIKNTVGVANTFKSTLTIETGSNGCYDCTLSNGDKVSFGDCNAGNNDGDNNNSLYSLGDPINVKPGEEGYFRYCKSLSLDKGNYKVTSENEDTEFTVFVEENGQIKEESPSVNGKAIIDLVPRKYKSVAFGVKNMAQNADTFSAGLTGYSGTEYNCRNGASRILAPIAALLGGLLFLF